MTDDGFQRVATLTDLPEQHPIGKSLANGEKIVLIRFGSEVYAIQECCSHADFPMEDGEIVDDYVIECAVHAAQFDVRDGSVIAEPAWEPLQTYDVKVEGDRRPRSGRQLERAVTERAKRDTQPPFSKEEVALIRNAVLTPGAAVECPRCGSLSRPTAAYYLERYDAARPADQNWVL